MTATGSAATASQVEVVASVSKMPAMEDEKDKREQAFAVTKQVFAGKDATKDKVRMTVKGEPDAVRVRLTAEMPVVKFLANVGMTMGAGK